MLFRATVSGSFEEGIVLSGEFEINTRGRMRHLAAMGYLIETGVDQYKLTNFTRSMALPQISGGYITL